MSLRVGVDLDGTLANLSKLYREVSGRFSEQSRSAEGQSEPQAEPDSVRLKDARADARRHQAVWRALQQTPDLWVTLDPLEAGAVQRLYALSLTLTWEVFFITQRPRSEGESVQRQTQNWLIREGFECPCVLTLRGPRGQAARALDLDFLIDDLPQNCVDVVSESSCRPILIQRKPDPAAELAARRLNIGIAASFHQALDLLTQPTETSRETTARRVLKSLRLV